jgi:ERCC4-type nuclease
MVQAARLLDTFGSVQGVISAGSDELQSVYDIGKGVADKIKWAVSEEKKLFIAKEG